jgi:hypothetical protein
MVNEYSRELIKPEEDSKASVDVAEKTDNMQ